MADISKITPPGSQTTYNLKDATAREQAAENKSNILTIYEQNGKTFNLFDFDKWKECGVDKGSKTVSGNTVTITASADNCYTYFQEVSAPFPKEARIPAAQGDSFIFTWDYTALDNQTNDTVYIFANGSSASGMYVNVTAQSERINFTAPAGTTFITFRLGVGSATKRARYSNIQIQTSTSYEAGFTDYQPYTMSNAELTAKEQANENNISSLSNPTQVTPTKSASVETKVSDIHGGYAVSGNVCNISIQFTVSDTIAATTWVFTGLPQSSIDITYGHANKLCAVSVVNMSTLDEIQCALGQYSSVTSGILTAATAIPVGTYSINFTYLTSAQ